jgi:hypothetical protein
MTTPCANQHEIGNLFQKGTAGAAALIAYTATSAAVKRPSIYLVLDQMGDQSPSAAHIVGVGLAQS